MQISSDTHERLMATYQLLSATTINIATFEHIRKIIKGIHPEIDKKLKACSKALDTLQKVQSGDIITLSAERMSEDTEEKKKRKKALLLFISSLKDLRSEIKRIDSEYTQINIEKNSMQNQLLGWGRIIKFAKGPFGVITFLALIIFVILLLQRNKGQYTKPVTPKTIVSPTTASNNLSKVKIIMYNGKQIPLSQLYVGYGPDCDSPHYHAVNGSVNTLDGTVIKDPENCGYGKLKDVSVIEVNISTNP